MKQEEKTNKEESKVEQHASQEEEEESITDEEEEEGRPELEQIPSEELGLEIISRRNVGWQTNMSPQEVVSDIESNKYKWTHNKTNIPDETILEMIKYNEIQLMHCWGVMSDANFKNLKNGFQDTVVVSHKPAKNKPNVNKQYNNGSSKHNKNYPTLHITLGHKQK